MQIVIDLPDENYQVTLTKIMLACYGCRIIELPKGHGRLIDESDLIPDSDYEDGTFYAVSIEQINRTPTIIEADMAESEDRCKNCEYSHNPDYTRCHECKAESEDKT